MATKFIPYGRQVIEDADIAAVVDVLRGDWLTTGPTVGRFEEAFAKFAGARHAIAVSNGTAALHLCALVCDLTSESEVIVPALTFAASANCVRYAGGKVVFADVREDTLTIDVAHVESLITSRTKAIVSVDYAGLPADNDALLKLADRHGLTLIEDACHAVGATYEGRKIGAMAPVAAFSFHPVKHLTTGEGGMITTNDSAVAERLRRLRNHGIATDHRQREQQGTWRYDMVELGYNYRLCDVQCALGLSQLARIPQSVERRRALARAYHAALDGIDALRLPVEPPNRQHAWHLYPVRFNTREPGKTREAIFTTMRSANIGVNVHYMPVYLHSYYASLGYRPGLCPVAERAYEGLLSLPMWHGLSDEDQRRVIATLKAALEEHA